ncbi:hypothetical protein MUN89_12345 [Halobacillus salinarum]|uniref:Uncharacterized protein n=1 Tax=Halobacillus salinarum TaxID=2932257 RepID=A0ABY4EE75_9BACI|nr:hypothetical protein [Halobacillus salinarum]UOQ42757.1 hypothetical protein MUN89_12345 [Halobacillus salinarum]
MVLLIMLVVLVYSSLMIWVLSKLGSEPAHSVLSLLKRSPLKNQLKRQKTYEESFSAK